MIIKTVISKNLKATLPLPQNSNFTNNATKFFEVHTLFFIKV